MSGIKFKNCLFDACKIPIESFRIPTDGRKWKAAAGNRKALMMHLAGYANADGTSIRPSTKTLADQTGFSRRKVCRLLDDLKVLGFCERVGRYGQRGAAIRRLLLPEKPSTTPPETSSLRVSDSIPESAGFDSQSVRFDSESATLGSQGAIAVAHNLPYRPANEPAIQPANEPWIGRMDSLFGQQVNKLPRELKPGLHHKKLEPELARLVERDGTDVVCKSWEYFLDNRDFDGLKQSALQLFLTEFEQHKAASKEAIRQNHPRQRYMIDPDAPDPFAPIIDPDALTPEQLFANRYKI